MSFVIEYRVSGHRKFASFASKFVREKRRMERTVRQLEAKLKAATRWKVATRA